MNDIVIVHGPSCLDLASIVAGRLDLTLVPHDDYPSPSELFREKRSVIVWGPLYVVKDDQLTSTALHSYLAYAKEVHKQKTICELCQVQCAVMKFDEESLCRFCGQDRLDRKPLTVKVQGEVTVDGDSVTVSALAYRITRKRTGKDLGDCLRLAISSIDESIPGPGNHHFILTVPYSLGSEVLARVKDELRGKNVSVEWK